MKLYKQSGRVNSEPLTKMYTKERCSKLARCSRYLNSLSENSQQGCSSSNSHFTKLFTWKLLYITIVLALGVKNSSIKQFQNFDRVHLFIQQEVFTSMDWRRGTTAIRREANCKGKNNCKSAAGTGWDEAAARPSSVVDARAPRPHPQRSSP